MTVVLNVDGRPQPDAFDGPFVNVEALSPDLAMGATIGLDVENTQDLSVVAEYLPDIEVIRVDFPAMGDGRGFSLASRLRRMGYAGRLRAAGPLVPDQAAALGAVGFAEVELPDQVAARWTPVSGPRGSYQARLFA